jgi:hypothetical protein
MEDWHDHTRLEDLLAEAFEDQTLLDEVQLAAAAYLARYRGRTLDAYRHDLRTFFQWAADIGLVVLDATGPHIEVYRAALEQRGLAASTIDRRLSTVCGFYRFAHIDGRSPRTRPSTSGDPRFYPTEGHGMDQSNWAGSCSRPPGIIWLWVLRDTGTCNGGALPTGFCDGFFP